MKWVKLRDVAHLSREAINPEKIQPQTKYVGLEHIDSEGDMQPEYVSEGDLASMKYAFQPHHILYGKLRPYLKKIGIPGFSGICSTDIIPIEVDARYIHNKYLSHFLRIDRMIAQAVKDCAGANLPRLSPQKLLDFLIPLPPLAEQARIAAVLDAADQLRRADRALLSKYDALTQAVFYEMFGDPVKNEKGWEVKKLGEVADKITDGEHQTPKRSGSGYMLLSARNIKNSLIDLNAGVDYVPEEEFKRIIRRCNPETGDILISCSGTIGRVCRVRITEPFVLVRSVALVKPDKKLIESPYLESLLQTNFMQTVMVRESKSSSQANLFTGPITKLPIMLPPLALQQAFAARVQAIESQKALAAEALERSEALMGSLMAEVFGSSKPS
ncbi:MAG: restriction endonuclease subunit S [Bacteroidia bacterium]|nr:restriction endonuclease subunit S [Bacteroidia bacterium]